MWLITALVLGGFIVFLGFTLYPVIAGILNSLNEDMVAGLPGLTAFEELVMDFYPMAVFLVIVLGAILVIRQARKKKE